MKKIVITLFIILSINVFAQPSTTVGTGSGQAGDTVTVTVDYFQEATVIDVQVDIEYNPAILTPAIDCGTISIILNCGTTVNGAGQNVVRIIGFNIPTAMVVSGSLATIDFTIAGGAPLGVVPLTVSGEIYGDGISPGGVPPNGSASGSITVVSGVQPDYSSAPIGGTTITLNGSTGTNPTSDVVITNAGSVGASPLTGTCALNGADAASFNITTPTALNIAQGANQTMTVDCDATTATATTLNASLDCTHNGDGTTEPSPVSYPLRCNIVASPQPDYLSAPVGGTTLALNGSIGTNPTSDVVITNAGPVMAPNLTGTCALSGADAASFNIATPALNVAQGANQTMTVDCDATTATAATLNASLDCTHNGDGTTESSPVSYPLTCDIAAISPQYDSNPVGGTAIAMGSVLQGGTNPAASIEINNDNGDATTTLSGTCTSTGPEISIVGSGVFSVLQGDPAVTIDFECDATQVPDVYTDVISCAHNGSNLPNPVHYEVGCEILAVAAVGNQNIPNGTDLNIVIPPGGTGTTSVIFSEVGGQGIDITDLACTITPGVGFAITSPGTFPATVPAAGSLPVIVTFTDPGDGSATSGSLDCSYTDGGGTQNVSYPLNFVIRALQIPTLSMVGYLVLTLGFGLISFFAFRRRA